MQLFAYTDATPDRFPSGRAADARSKESRAPPQRADRIGWRRRSTGPKRPGTADAGSSRPRCDSTNLSHTSAISGCKRLRISPRFVPARHAVRRRRGRRNTPRKGGFTSRADASAVRPRGEGRRERSQARGGWIRERSRCAERPPRASRRTRHRFRRARVALPRRHRSGGARGARGRGSSPARPDRVHRLGDPRKGETGRIAASKAQALKTAGTLRETASRPR